MSKFEKKFGKYAIKNLSLCLIICYAFGYIISLINPAFLSFLTLDPYLIIFHGQIWRLFSWILIPPTQLSIWVLITLYFYYSIGSTLERTWGSYRYNVYIFSGMLYTVIGSFLLMGVLFLIYMGQYKDTDSAMAFLQFASGSASFMFSTYYINMSIFLAFAATFPDVQVLLMFIIPIKVKWLGLVYGLMLGINVVSSLIGGNLYNVFVIGASLLNFVIFFISVKKRRRLSPKQVKRRIVYKQQVKKAESGARHKCAICGRTENDGEQMEFRFCSKCEGNYEYCQDHLFTHEHIKKSR